MKNPFQKAAEELNALDSGLSVEDYRVLGAGRFIRFTTGNAQCQEGDEGKPVTLFMHGKGTVQGDDLADAVAKMKALITGAEPAKKSAAGKK